MMWLRALAVVAAALLAVAGLGAIALSVMLAFPVSSPPALESIRAGALAIDRSGMADLSYFQARDGSSLAYRVYPAANGDKRNVAILIHGSGGHSTVMNGIAKRLAAENFLVVVPDVRGHGASGTRGDIGYYGQLDDDLDDLIAELRRQYLTGRFALLGFSSGGGFALRAASGSLSAAFTRLVLVSPYLGYDAPSTRRAEDFGHLGQSGYSAYHGPELVAAARSSLLRSAAGDCVRGEPGQREICYPALFVSAVDQFRPACRSFRGVPPTQNTDDNHHRRCGRIDASGQICRSRPRIRAADQCSCPARTHPHGHAAHAGRDRGDCRSLQR